MGGNALPLFGKTLRQATERHTGLDAAWEDASADAADTATAFTGPGARSTARHSQQVLAGIGFTLEHAYRGALVLDELVGSARTLTKPLGDDVPRTRRTAAVLPF